MKLIGLMVVRNEAWILPASLPAALQWVDELVVLMHNCTDGTDGTDGTSELIENSALSYHPRLFWRHVDNSEWDEAQLRGELLEVGRKRSGTHFAIIDADEILGKPAVPQIRAAASLLQPGQLLRLPWLHCWRSLDNYRADNSPFGNARVPFLFRDAPHLAYAPDADGYQLHKRYPAQCQPVSLWERDTGMGVLHLQHANWARVTAKQKRYAEDELRRWGKVRANYAAATDETGLQLKPIPKEWWPVAPELVDLGAVAWQAKE